MPANNHDDNVVDQFEVDRKKLGLDSAEKKDEELKDEEADAPESKDEEAKDESADEEESDSEEKDEAVKDEEESKDESEAEDDEESEDDSEEEDPPAGKKFVPVPEHNKLKRAFRDYRRDTNQKIEDLKGALAKYDKADDTDEKDAIDDEVKAAAEKLGVDPEQIKVIVDLARKGLEPKKDIEEKVDTVIQKLNHEEEVAHFAKEWEAQVPEIKKAYPKATDSQIAKAKAEIDKIAHSKEFHTYSLDYVIFKNKAILNKFLFSPSKKGLDSSQITRKDDPGAKKEYKPLSDKSTPKEIEARQKELMEAAADDQEGITIIDNDGQERVER